MSFFVKLRFPVAGRQEVQWRTSYPTFSKGVILTCFMLAGWILYQLSFRNVNVLTVEEDGIRNCERNVHVPLLRNRLFLHYTIFYKRGRTYTGLALQISKDFRLLSILRVYLNYLSNAIVNVLQRPENSCRSRRLFANIEGPSSMACSSPSVI